jgi:hypothetical protein
MNVRFSSIRWPVLLAAVILLFVAGCSSGRVGGFYLLDSAVAVEDARADFQRTAVYRDRKVEKLHGTLVPTVAAGRWLVLQELVQKPRMVRTSVMRPEQRLPVWVYDHRLSAYDLETGQVTPLANTLDTDDTQMRDVRLVGDRLLAIEDERYNVQAQPGPPRYMVCTVPDGDWVALPRAEGKRLFSHPVKVGKFADLRTPAAQSTSQPAHRKSSRWGPITSFADLKARGLTHGDWGELFEREVSGRDEVVLKTRSGQEIVLLKQNVLDIPNYWWPKP